MDTAETLVPIRPRIQRLLLSDEYFEFEELVLVEAAFAQVTRRGRGIRQVQIAVTPSKFIIATDELGGDDTDSLFYVSPDDVEPEMDALEMVSIVPIECINLSVFSRRRRKLKARFCNGKVYYFELSERGTLSAGSAESVWRQWEERVEFLCPNLNSSSSETSVANSSSTLSTLERRRSLRQLAVAGKGQVQISWYARGSQLAGGSKSERAESSVWMTSDENELAAAGATRIKTFSTRKTAMAPGHAAAITASRSPTANKTSKPTKARTATTATSSTTDSSAVTCSTCESSETSSDSSSTATSTVTTRPSAVPRLVLGGDDTASLYSRKSRQGGGDVAAAVKPDPAEPRRSQTLMINRFGTGVEEKCSLSLYLSSDTALDLSTGDRQRLTAFSRVADDSLKLWELSALSRKHRHTRHSVLAPLAERHVGWLLLTPAARALARVRRSASETRLGTVSVRRRSCGQTSGEEFHLPLRRGDLCSSVSLADMTAALHQCRETVAGGRRLVFWRSEQADRPLTGHHVYSRRLQLLREYSAAHERGRVAERQRTSSEKAGKEKGSKKNGKMARGLSKLSVRAKQSATSQAIKKTYKQVFRSLSGTKKTLSAAGKQGDGDDAAAGVLGRRTASESRINTIASVVPGRQRSVSLNPAQRQRGRPGDETDGKPSGGGGSGGFCQFITPRRVPSGDEPDDDVTCPDRLSTRSEITWSITDDATSRITSTLLPDSDDINSQEPSMLDSVSGHTGPVGRFRAVFDAAAMLPGATTLRRVREIDSTVLAHQMTLLDREMLSRVTPGHLAGLLVRTDPRKQHSIIAIMLMFHRLVCLVATNVLLEDTYRDRAKVVTKLVTVAERCYHLRNFHSCKAVLSGLQSVPVYRLRRTWEYMKTKHDRKYRSFKSLSKLFADTRLPPFQQVFADVVASGAPFVPFFGDVVNAILGHNAPATANVITTNHRADSTSIASPRSPVLMWVQRHFDAGVPEAEAVAAARARVLARKYVTRWRATVRRRRLRSRQFRPSWLQQAADGEWAWAESARRQLRGRLAADCAALADTVAQARRIAAQWRQWRRGVDQYQLEERQLVREYLLLARHYTMETALGLSIDREPPDGSSCTLCSNTGMATDTSAEPAGTL